MTTQILFPHISINVSDLSRSVDFYKAFFGVLPVKERPGYAKFELQNPKLNFTLNEREHVSHAQELDALNHFGLQVATTDYVVAIAARLGALGIATENEMKTTCCYALQDKTWVKDPDGISWEVFTV